MEKPLVGSDRLRLVTSVAMGVLVATAVALLAGPLLVLSLGLGSPPSLLGFGRRYDDLIALVMRSTTIALGSAVVATGAAALCATISILDSCFGRVFKRVSLALVMSNPLFLVLAFSIVLVHFEPYAAVFITTSVVIFPFAAVVMQGFLKGVDPREIMAAESLGATDWQLVQYHIVPGLRSGVAACTTLSFLYALGFFLLPTLVGLGRIVTLGSSIHHAVSRVGDWEGASQLAVLASALGFTMLGIVAWRSIRWHRG